MSGDSPPRRPVRPVESGAPRAEGAVAVVLGEGVAEFARLRGGAIRLSLRESRCCSGVLAYLDATAGAPTPTPIGRTWVVEGVEVDLVSPMRRSPERIDVELRGRRRPRLAAYLDGCAFRP